MSQRLETAVKFHFAKVAVDDALNAIVQGDESTTAAARLQSAHEVLALVAKEAVQVLTTEEMHALGDPETVRPLLQSISREA